MRELDDLLTSAAPPLAPRTPELGEALDALVAGEPPRRRRRIRLSGVGLVVAVLLATGAGAYAGSVLFPQPRWDGERTYNTAVHLELELPNGEECGVTYELRPVGTATRRYDTEEWERIWQVVKDYLRRLDPATLDTEAIRDRFRASAVEARERVIATAGEDEAPPPMTEADVTALAPGAELGAQLREELARRGLPQDAFVTGASNSCRTEWFE